MFKKWRWSILIGLTFPILLLIMWELAARSFILPKFMYLPSSLSAPPSRIIVELFSLLIGDALAKHALFSFLRLIIAVCIGSILGIISGMLIGQLDIANRIFSPFLQIIAPIPVVVWMPFAVMAFGTGEAYKVSIGVIATFLIMHMHSFLAVRHTKRDYLELADMYEKNMIAKIRHIYLPASSPSIFAAIRISLAIGWIVIFLVEYASAREGTQGLGWFIRDARSTGKVEQEYAGVILLAFIGYITDVIVYRIQRFNLKWLDIQDEEEIRRVI